MPATCTATATCYSGQGTPEAGVVLSFTLVDAPDGDGASYDSAEFTATSGGDGVATVTLLRGAQYKGRRGTGPWTLFTTPDAATFDLPQLNGQT
jgi:hypothetical protein